MCIKMVKKELVLHVRTVLNTTTKFDFDTLPEISGCVVLWVRKSGF